MKLKSFYANLAFLILANLLVKPFYIFGIDRTVQLRVGEGEYGLYFALYNFSVLFYIFLDLGLTQYNTRTVSQHPDQLPKNFFNFIIAKSLLGFAYLFIVVLAATFNGYGPKAFDWLLYLIMNQILISFIFFCRSSIAALQKFRLDAFLSVLDRVLVIGICAFLLWGLDDFDFNISHFLKAQTAAYTLAAIISFISLSTSIKNPVLSINFKAIQYIFKQSLPFAILIFLTIIFTRIDAVMLERILKDGAKETDIYAAGFRLLDALNIVGLLFATLLFPIFSKLIQKKKSVTPLANSSFMTIFFLSSSAAILFYTFRNDVTQLLYGTKFELIYTANILGVLLLSFVPIASNYVFNTLLNASNHLKPLIYLALFGVFLNILLNLYFIPVQKAYGAALATVITQYIIGIGHIFLAIYFMKITFKKKDLFKKTTLIALGSFCTLLLKNNIQNWLIAFFVSGCLLIILGWALKLLRPDVFLQKDN